eukprot:7817970-Pyramimonas_sp.AAC.1
MSPNLSGRPGRSPGCHLVLNPASLGPKSSLVDTTTYYTCMCDGVVVYSPPLPRRTLIHSGMPDCVGGHTVPIDKMYAFGIYGGVTRSTAAVDVLQDRLGEAEAPKEGNPKLFGRYSLIASP